jgi:hypothetical protein
MKAKELIKSINKSLVNEGNFATFMDEVKRLIDLAKADSFGAQQVEKKVNKLLAEYGNSQTDVNKPYFKTDLIDIQKELVRNHSMLETTLSYVNRIIRNHNA